jgi:tetratricopeptide (TPR) repeat protein
MAGEKQTIEIDLNPDQIAFIGVMKLLPVLLLAFVLSLGVACSYEPSFESEQQEARAYLNRGIEYHALGQYERAIQSYDEAIRLDPENAKTYNKRGVVRANLGQYERAIQSYDEAIRLDPEYATAYYNRGNAFEALGNSIKAEQDLAKAKELGVS